MKSRIPTIIIAFIIPMSAIFLAFPIYNRIEPFVFGLSFNYFWIFSWLFLTALCIFIGFRLDPYNDPNVAKASAEALEAAKASLADGSADSKGGKK